MKTGAVNFPTSLAACSLELRTAGADVLLLPAGVFQARDGRPQGLPGWHLTDTRARAIVATAARRRTPFVIDYEHQTLHAEKNGQPAPRAGRHERLEWRPGDGLYAVDVVWTKRAQQFIADDEYGLISPVFSYDRKTGEILDYFHAALTNDPAVDAMRDVATLTARFLPSPPTKDTTMHESLRELLGLTAEATDDDGIAALKALIDKRDQDLAAKDQAIAELKTRLDDGNSAPDPEKWISREAFDELKAEVARLSSRQVSDEVENLVTTALKDGRLVPAEKAWATQYGQQDLEGLKGYLETQKPIAALKRTQTEGRQPETGGDGVLSADELALCRQCGIEPEDYKKANGLAAA